MDSTGAHIIALWHGGGGGDLDYCWPIRGDNLEIPSLQQYNHVDKDKLVATHS
jgi:hypothetical protein